MGTPLFRHNTSTSVTDGRTDRTTIAYSTSYIDERRDSKLRQRLYFPKKKLKNSVLSIFPSPLVSTFFKISCNIKSTLSVFTNPIVKLILIRHSR